MTHARAFPRSGFALPLALFMLTIVALVAMILLQGSVEELRVARGEVAAVRAEAAAGSALSDELVTAPDSVALARPRGTITLSISVAGAETTRVARQSLGAGLVRVTAVARVWSGGMRADASSVAFFRIVADSAGTPGSLRYQRLPGWWWAQIP